MRMTFQFRPASPKAEDLSGSPDSQTSGVVRGRDYVCEPLDVGDNRLRLRRR